MVQSCTGVVTSSPVPASLIMTGVFTLGPEALERFTTPLLVSLGRLSGVGEILGTARMKFILWRTY